MISCYHWIMTGIKEKLRSLTEDDYKKNLIDLHIHTSCSDGKVDAQELLNSAKNKNYKFIAITDHNTFDAHEKVKDEILITGAEFDCWYKGVFIHLLAYGVDIHNDDLKPFIAKNKRDTEDTLVRLFSKRDVAGLINAIHSAEGIVVLAHPACYWAINLEHFVKKLVEIGLDGIEVYYPYPRFRKIVKFHSADTVAKIANNYPSLLKTGGTDFHSEKF